MALSAEVRFIGRRNFQLGCGFNIVLYVASRFVITCTKFKARGSLFLIKQTLSSSVQESWAWRQVLN